MSLASTYALACGTPLCKPQIHDSFFPTTTPLDKVILVHAFAGALNQQNGQFQVAFPAKIYDHFAEVLELLRPIVEPLGYRFYQIGGPHEPPLKGAEYLCGKTSLHQCAYLVKRAALLIGNDSMWMHVRGAYEGALVGVYGPTDVKNHGPHWVDAAKAALIESHRAGRKPSYSSHEGPKTINWITPESIASAALKLLGIPDTITRRSFYFGPDYNTVSFEIVPNMVPEPSANLGVPVIRMDFEFNEQILAQNLSIRKCAIATDREINLNLLAQFKGNIALLRIEVDKLDQNWIKQVKRVGVPLQAICDETDPEKIAGMRLALYDAVLFDTVEEPTKENLRKEIGVYLNSPLDSAPDLSTLSFRTNRFVLSKGKIYLSTPHWRADRAAESLEKNSGEVIDTAEFWAEQKSFYLYTL